ncbi:hypothetical protein [Rubellicoccus peritrichatus]|uniref:Uncharacterized protein n=1 Tax=Rubellicoccus peritrichatus TaxID=3080537 RepID=A0AAQ3QQN8_9BACT|nr:hypothetical protein [Puniceicoccus sp. CR14]WOO40365.1 hypothetical protein RZN69_17235 [Puniceicoccus sp. CR14]WOO40414.1 hypothetical protein RZN69_17480 [Puniceicoccus sp. CR14]WOO40463.1 hypothetical protein RZN69_17725 [Puniceicoccus sp. CR14]WOO40512.1 hypothetical protein RZN69_17970 [Puniceicoccus sp. CR14]
MPYIIHMGSSWGKVVRTQVSGYWGSSEGPKPYLCSTPDHEDATQFPDKASARRLLKKEGKTGKLVKISESGYFPPE